MYDKRGDLVASDPDQIFLVFVNDTGIVYNWRWEFADEADPEIPVGKERFALKIFDRREPV
jgi:hypothetical protein